MSTNQTICKRCYCLKDNNFPFCAKCHSEMNTMKRSNAIESGLCVNHWKCHAPADRAGGMCVNCYNEFKRVRYHEVIPQNNHIPVVVNAPPVIDAKNDFPKIPKSVKQKKNISGNNNATTIFWKSLPDKVREAPTDIIDSAKTPDLPPAPPPSPAVDQKDN